MQQLLEIIAVLFAAAYLVLVIRQSIWCWPAGLISVVLFMFIYFNAKLYMQSSLQVYYIVISIYGWLQWVKGGDQHAGVRVQRWPLRAHAAIIASIIVISAIMGWVLTGTDSEYPYLDSFATTAALFTTFMVARKVIENWIYWFVIDALLVYLFWQSELPWNAVLYSIYLVMVVIGFLTWLKTMRAEEAGIDDPAGA
jgi:nicotinamide mononucleotide transporter